MHYQLLLLAALALGLTSCGKDMDIQTACYKNGPHDRMSDGRIIRMCTCVSENMNAASLPPRKTAIVVSMLRGKELKDLTSSEVAQGKALGIKLSAVRQQCEKLK